MHRGKSRSEHAHAWAARYRAEPPGEARQAAEGQTRYRKCTVEWTLDFTTTPAPSSPATHAASASRPRPTLSRPILRIYPPRPKVPPAVHNPLDHQRLTATSLTADQSGGRPPQGTGELLHRRRGGLEAVAAALLARRVRGVAGRRPGRRPTWLVVRENGSDQQPQTCRDRLSYDNLVEAAANFCFDLPLRLLASGSSGASKRTAVWSATAAPPGGGGGLAPIASQLGQAGSAELDH